MIRFSLVCDNDHEFESWFPGNDAYESQSDRGLVACPICHSLKVSKAIMAPAISRGDRAAAARAPRPVALVDEKTLGLRQMMREMRAKIVEHTVDVGADFPQEARRIHDGETPERSIRGEASPDEARALLEEGIAIVPIPVLPDEWN